MPLITVVCGLILIPVGLVIFDQTGREHYTALIPAALGGLLVLLGALSFRDGLRKHTMHLAALVGVIGMIAAGYRAVPGLIKLSTGEPVSSMPALVGTSITTGVCLVFVVLCVNSFIQARRRRRAQEPV